LNFYLALMPDGIDKKPNLSAQYCGSKLDRITTAESDMTRDPLGVRSLGNTKY
jgi:hypothetical protein